MKKKGSKHKELGKKKTTNQNKIFKDFFFIGLNDKRGWEGGEKCCIPFDGLSVGFKKSMPRTGKTGKDFLGDITS